MVGAARAHGGLFGLNQIVDSRVPLLVLHHISKEGIVHGGVVLHGGV